MTIKRQFMQFGGACATALTLLLGQAAQAETEMIDQIVAIVDDDIILASELRERLATVSQNLKAQGVDAPPEDELIRETLDRLILDSIQMQMGDRYGVRISDPELDNAMQRIAAQNRLTLDQFRQTLEQEGRSYVAMREQVRQEMILQRVQMGNVNQRVSIAEQEVTNFLETEEGQKLVEPEYRVMHALLPIPSRASSDFEESAREHTEQLLAKIRDGERFDAVMAGSEGEFSYTGGDLGWRKVDDLPSLYQDVVPELEAGETTDVFRSPSGFHLVHVTSVRGGKQTQKQTLVRHILVTPSEILTDEQAREKALGLKRQIEEDGADFAELARKHSEDIGSASEGGSLGWTSRGQMVPEFENMMASTEIGDISQPVRSQFGWHIIQVDDRRVKDTSQEARVARATEFLHQRKYDEELEAWLQMIRDEAFVDIK
ncbi:MAG: peptidylprolyl isomerase [Chromatocurvus sp.]